jgi:chorismate-pyruvate lyase
VSTRPPRTQTRSLSQRPRTRISATSVLYPWDRVCARTAVVAPSVTVISPTEIPQPYRSLLVHDSDMTRTLEQHSGDRAILRPLSTFVSGTSYFRRVLLVKAASGHPLAMGAIRVRLDVFPPRLRAKIVAGEIPLGRILREGRFSYTSTVTALLAVEPTAEMMGIFWMPESRTLYGRRSEMFRKNTKFADIVEVLPPASKTRASRHK